MKSSYSSKRALLMLVCIAVSPSSFAAGFSAGVSPSKFELTARPGQVLRDTLTIMNPTADGADYQFRSADWRLNETGSVEFVEDTLVDGSCRPWVRLERQTVRINAGAQKNYRFEIHVPEDASPGLCKFAMIIEPSEAYLTALGDSGVTIPIVGRYAVITYVTIGDASAAVEFLGIGTQDLNGQRLPTMTLRNSGNTYDRAFGQLTATNGQGDRIPLIPSSFPILPGRTEELAFLLDVDPEDAAGVTLSYPLTLRGQIEIGREVYRIDQTLQ